MPQRIRWLSWIAKAKGGGLYILFTSTLRIVLNSTSREIEVRKYKGSKKYKG